MIQGIGHGELIQNEKGDYYFICLGFRQVHMWGAQHILGREVIRIPINLEKEDCSFTENEGMAEKYEI